MVESDGFTVRRGNFTGLHDSFCRCRSCKPAQVGMARLRRAMFIGMGLGAAFIVGVALYA